MAEEQENGKRSLPKINISADQVPLLISKAVTIGYKLTFGIVGAVKAGIAEGREEVKRLTTTSATAEQTPSE